LSFFFFKQQSNLFEKKESKTKTKFSFFVFFLQQLLFQQVFIF